MFGCESFSILSYLRLWKHSDWKLLDFIIQSDYIEIKVDVYQHNGLSETSFFQPTYESLEQPHDASKQQESNKQDSLLYRL